MVHHFITFTLINELSILCILGNFPCFLSHADSYIKNLHAFLSYADFCIKQEGLDGSPESWHELMMYWPVANEITFKDIYFLF